MHTIFYLISIYLYAYKTVCDPCLATKPCRHLLLGGECLRSDCGFSHDFATTPCRYWLQDQCANLSEACPFLHDLDVPAAAVAAGGGGGQVSEEVEVGVVGTKVEISLTFFFLLFRERGGTGYTIQQAFRKYMVHAYGMV